MAEALHVERGVGRHEEHTLGDGAEESGENPVGASVRAGARGSGRGTVHIVGSPPSSGRHFEASVGAHGGALLALGREAYPLLGEGVLDLRVAERLRELARNLRVALPCTVGTEISSSKIARKIQVFEEKQQQARVPEVQDSAEMGVTGAMDLITRAMSQYGRTLPCTGKGSDGEEVLELRAWVKG
ncbi:unnamed protein product [Lampetra fluviatilis]